MLLLFIAQIINDRVLLSSVDNSEELLNDNIAVACVEAGSLVACGRIMQAVLSGNSASVGEGFATILLYWVSGQFILLLFSACYRKVTSFEDEAQIKQGNVAVGLSSGLTLVAVAFVITAPILKYGSYPIFLLVSFVGIAFLTLTLTLTRTRTRTLSLTLILTLTLTRWASPSSSCSASSSTAWCCRATPSTARCSSRTGAPRSSRAPPPSPSPSCSTSSSTHPTTRRAEQAHSDSSPGGARRGRVAAVQSLLHAGQTSIKANHGVVRRGECVST